MASATIAKSNASSSSVTIAADVDTLEDQLSGTAGIASYPAGATAANNVSIAEVLRFIDQTLIGVVNATTTDGLQGKIGTDTEMADSSLFDMLAGTAGIATFPAAATAASGVSLAEVIRYIEQTLIGGIDAATTDGLHGKIGTDTEMADNSLYDLLGGAGLKTDALHDILMGTTGIATFPAAAAAANNVSLAEVIRYMSEHQGTFMVNKAATTTPQGTATAQFTIASGNVELIGIVGEVTTVIETAANNAKLTFNPTGTGASTDLCTTLNITADAVGTFYSITGTVADPLQSNLWFAPSQVQPLVLGPGTIDLDCDASTSGETEWHMLYRRIDTAATVS